MLMLYRSFTKRQTLHVWLPVSWKIPRGGGVLPLKPVYHACPATSEKYPKRGFQARDKIHPKHVCQKQIATILHNFTNCGSLPGKTATIDKECFFHVKTLFRGHHFRIMFLGLQLCDFDTLFSSFDCFWYPNRVTRVSRPTVKKDPNYAFSWTRMIYRSQWQWPPQAP